ncbi:MAG: hypothetical protein ACLPVW_18060 [Terriglobales bacterium]
MFRAEIHQLANGPTLKMEGRLVGDWAEQAKSLVTKASVPKGLIVDLTDVTYVDSVGEQVLNWFKSIGAAFLAKGIYAAGVCERLRLPFQGKLHAPTKERLRRDIHKLSPGQRRAS